jgi:hypothetical protein
VSHCTPSCRPHLRGAPLRCSPPQLRQHASPAVQQLIRTVLASRSARTPLHLACLMAGKHMSRGSRHVEIARYLVQEGAATSTQDRWNRVPLAYLPQSAKRLGINTPAAYAPSAVWAVEEVTRGGAVLDGSVAQSTTVHLLRN